MGLLDPIELIVLSIPLIVASALVVAAIRWRRQTRLVEELSREVGALAEGRPVRTIRARVGGAATRLAEQFNHAAPLLEERIRRLEEDRQKLQAVLSGMAEGVIAVDGRQRLVFANPAAEQLFGLDQGSVGRLVPELIRNPQIQQAVETTLAGSRPFRGEITMPGRDVLAPEQARMVSVQGTPLPGTPPTGAVLVMHDVTELRRLERMRQDFVANASHELKTPLASIKVNTETLLDWALHDETVNVMLLQQINGQVDRVNALIHDMLSLARLESGAEPYTHEPIRLVPLIQARVEAQQTRASAQGLELRLDLNGLDEDIEIRAAEEAIRQILDNLIDNAIKYTPPGGRVLIRGRSDSNDEVTLSVTDTGVGIPRDDLPRVFERFYRVDKARSRDLGGTGLGLAIVKHLVQSLGGQINVESRVGAGSTFLVRLRRVH